MYEIDGNFSRSFGRDEFRRELRASETENRVAVRSFREALKRHFNGERSSLSTEAKAEILGVRAPGRRNFFRVGGVGLAGAVLLAACGDDDDEEATPPETDDETTSTEGGDTTGSTDNDDDESAEEPNMDVVLARGAAATELGAVAAYQAAIESNLVTTQAFVDAALLFQRHHQEHADALNSIVADAGGEEMAEPLPEVLTLLEGAVLMDELSVAAFARGLEDAAASTYVFGAALLSTPELRQALMSIGGVEARHVTAIDMLLMSLGAGPGATFDDGAFYPTTRSLSPEALTELG